MAGPQEFQVAPGYGVRAIIASRRMIPAAAALPDIGIMTNPARLLKHAGN
jgi:hypothetical protein